MKAYIFSKKKYKRKNQMTEAFMPKTIAKTSESPFTEVIECICRFPFVTNYLKYPALSNIVVLIIQVVYLYYLLSW